MMVAPSFAEKHVKSIFAAADSNHVGQVKLSHKLSCSNLAIGTNN